MKVEARAGDQFEIRVEQMGSAGYQWLVEPLPTGISLIEDRVASPASPSPPGSPAERVFAFQAEQPGHYEIELIQKRPWESEALTHRRYEVEVS